eukprot:CAMPEP_0176434738 /NCGR_PEP_ID=MMETSP0127-20121128/16868_1 /TAXON_ID=938130 /ORGANISM="Platyophrya macrostoma, Strain WH" /LENGTH=315 /DNA_ID=CAMNT_0017817557 /DNA_START=45 /DNA_END=992 /DNA_ORIENTATION=-
MKSVSVTQASSQLGSPQMVPRSLSRKKFGAEFDLNKKTLVLDLDQTLVYLTLETPSKESNYVEISDQGRLKSYAVKRPGLDQFMKDMSADYNICIYSANKQRYVHDVVKAVGLTPYIFEIYTREHCTKVSEKTYMKSLLNLGFSLTNTIFVDDSEAQMRCQPLNGVLIQPYRGEIGDSALIYLIPFLRHISTLSDVRPVTQKLFTFYEQSSKSSKKKRSGSKKRVSPKSKATEALPLISEEVEGEAVEEEKPTQSKFVRKERAVTVGMVGLKNITSEDTKRSHSLPSQSQLENMHSHDTISKGESTGKCDSLTEL